MKKLFITMALALAFVMTNSVSDSAFANGGGDWHKDKGRQCDKPDRPEPPKPQPPVVTPKPPKPPVNPPVEPPKPPKPPVTPDPKPPVVEPEPETPAVVQSSDSGAPVIASLATCEALIGKPMATYRDITTVTGPTNMAQHEWAWTFEVRTFGGTQFVTCATDHEEWLPRVWRK